jgi:hypothetical protein
MLESRVTTAGLESSGPRCVANLDTRPLDARDVVDWAAQYTPDLANTNSATANVPTVYRETRQHVNMAQWHNACHTPDRGALLCPAPPCRNPVKQFRSAGR